VKQKLLSLLCAILTALTVLTGAIAVPILCRPFYYAHVDAYHLTVYGWSQDEIYTAYNEMMDYCTGRREDFSAGVLAFSESGASHFADVRGLFLLDLQVLFLCLPLLAVLLVVCRWKRLAFARFWGRGPGFWAAAGLGGGFIAVGLLAALDFDRAFVIFHQIFFPGKENWIFDYRTDPIILLLPQDFFRNCALLILGLLLVWCGTLIVLDFRGKNGTA